MLAATKVKVCGSDKIRKTYNISSLKRVTRKFLKQTYKKGAARA